LLQKPPCEWCGAGLPNDYLPDHLQSEHRLGSQSGPLIGQHASKSGLPIGQSMSMRAYECNVCRQTFTWSQMVAHLLNVHNLSRKAVIDQMAAPVTLKIAPLDLDVSGRANLKLHIG